MAESQFTPEELLAEEWFDIPGFEGIYHESTLGRIKSLLARTRWPAGRILIGRLAGTGDYKYITVWLCRDGVKVWRYVHHIIAEFFLGPRPVGNEINHKDRDKHNNRPGNLEYKTPEEHRAHTKENGLIPHGKDHWMYRTPEKIPRGDAHWSRRRPELIPRGERSGRIKKPESYPVGVDHYKAKLTEDDIHAIDAYLKSHSQYEAADKFEVSQQTISKAHNKKSYKDVPRL